MPYDLPTYLPTGITVSESAVTAAAIVTKDVTYLLLPGTILQNSSNLFEPYNTIHFMSMGVIINPAAEAGLVLYSELFY